MTKIYSYVLRFDEGAAPNPFWGTCTLTICKPAIRRNAQIGDWVVGTGSKKAKCNDGNIYDLSDSVIYAMKIKDIKTLQDYDKYCNTSLKEKIPNWRASDWRLRMGDCIYDYSKRLNPLIRKSVHNEENRKRDLSGLNALLSNEFYYFGEEARPLPENLKQIIKRNQGHRKIENAVLIRLFEEWIKQFEKNKPYADPQMRSIFDRQLTDEVISTCGKQHFDEDEDETEETFC
jgi:Nucleotide modification associated domain 2